MYRKGCCVAWNPGIGKELMLIVSMSLGSGRILNLYRFYFYPSTLLTSDTLAFCSKPTNQNTAMDPLILA